MPNATYEVTNTSRGPRFVHRATGGATTIPPGGSATVELTEGEFKSLSGRDDLEIKKAGKAAARAAAPAPAPIPTGGGPQPAEAPNADGEPQPSMAAVGAAGISTDAGPPVTGDATPTRVEHEGFGKWFAYAGDDRIGEQMTRAEATKYAAENSIPGPGAE